MAWPKRGDDPFATESDSSTICSLNLLKSLNTDDSSFANNFKYVADKIIDELQKQRETGIRRIDAYFIPVMFLYRHCLELKLKHLIRLCVKLDLIEKKDKLSDTLYKHELYSLWNHVKLGLQKYWPEAPTDDLKAVERVIQQFHELDNNGQSLRYAEDKNGDKTVNHFPERVDFIKIKKIFDGSFSLLDGCCGVFKDDIDAMSQYNAGFSE
jgi:hypothetical protein